MSMASNLVAGPETRVALPREMRAGVYRGPGRVATEYVPVPQIPRAKSLFE